MPPSNKPDIDDTHFTYGSKPNNCVESNSVSNDFVSCDNSDKSSDSESTGLASCVSSVKSSSLKTKDQLASASSSVDLKTLHKTKDQLASASSSVDLKTLHQTDDQGPCNVTQSPSFSFKENVKTPRNLCHRNRLLVLFMLKRCEDTKLALNWEKSHFMVKEGIVLGHKISRKGN
ncbi:hypothetical protein Tco_0106664 [Tanacetum coccineum]